MIRGGIGLLVNLVDMILGGAGMVLGFAFLTTSKLSVRLPPAFRESLLTDELVGALSESESLIAYSQCH